MERYPEAEPLTRQAVEGFRPSRPWGFFGGEIFLLGVFADAFLFFPFVFLGNKVLLVFFVVFFFISPIWEHIFRRIFLLTKPFFCQNHFMNMVKLKEEYRRVLSHVRSAGIWSLWPHQTPLKERGDEGAWEHKLPGPNWVLTIQIHCGVCYISARCCRLDRKNQQHGRVHLGRSALILGTFLFLWVQHQWDSNPSIWQTFQRCQNGKHVYIIFQEHRKEPVEVATPPKNPLPKSSPGPKRSKSNKPLPTQKKTLSLYRCQPANQNSKSTPFVLGILDNQNSIRIPKSFQKPSKINGWLYGDYPPGN